MLWSKQYYHYVVTDWLEGDPPQPMPPPERSNGRKHDWTHLFTRDVISMPDQTEQDHAALAAAARQGRIAAVTEF
jgi:hypothetical protein